MPQALSCRGSELSPSSKVHSSALLGVIARYACAGSLLGLVCRLFTVWATLAPLGEPDTAETASPPMLLTWLGVGVGLRVGIGVGVGLGAPAPALHCTASLYTLTTYSPSLLLLRPSLPHLSSPFDQVYTLGSAMLVPIPSLGGEPLGVLQLVNRKLTPRFDDADLALAEAFAAG